jgi:mRNA-degrading endonuclease RelE of RelBE toxin-antitoxin system
LEVKVSRGVLKTLRKYPQDYREKIFGHISLLEDPYGASGVECLFAAEHIYRMHIGRSYTIIFKIVREDNTVLVLDVMTIEQAHKRYSRYH